MAVSDRCRWCGESANTEDGVCVEHREFIDPSSASTLLDVISLIERRQEALLTRIKKLEES
mgnify:FL=1